MPTGRDSDNSKPSPEKERPTVYNDRDKELSIGYSKQEKLALVPKPTDPAIILLFWPTSIVGIADPTGPMNQAVFGLIMFGGNFLLYGAFGAIAGIAADRLRR
jgi:hypothetical protein